MLRIGITGGIGSGKSTVAGIFSVLGIPIYDSDNASKRIMAEDENLRKNIIASFGESSYVGGTLNRKYLAAQVFNDSKKLALLNSLVHPATINDAKQWMEKQQSVYVIKEAALIFESGSNEFLDYVVGVQSTPTLRIERAMKRDNVTREEIEARMKLQMDEDEKMKRCDFIIMNDEQQMLIPQVISLHKRFLDEGR